MRAFVREAIKEDLERTNQIYKKYVDRRTQIVKNHMLAPYAEWVIIQVCEYLKLSIDVVKSRTRTEYIVEARTFIVGIIEENTTFSDFSMIFVNRERSTFYNTQLILDQLIRIKEKAKIYEELKSLCSLSSYNRAGCVDNK